MNVLFLHRLDSSNPQESDWITAFVHLLLRPALSGGQLQFWPGWLGTGVLFGFLGNLTAILLEGAEFR